MFRLMGGWSETGKFRKKSKNGFFVNKIKGIKEKFFFIWSTDIEKTATRSKFVIWDVQESKKHSIGKS